MNNCGILSDFKYVYDLLKNIPTSNPNKPEKVAIKALLNLNFVPWCLGGENL